MRASRCVVVGALVAAWGACAARAAGEVVLVREGQPAATIVVAAEPSENAKAAAAELVQYVEKMSGARLPIVSDADPAEGTLVLVGRSRLTDQMEGLEIPAGVSKKLREEGFVILCRDNRVVLAGNDEAPYRGTRYAVCDLLHRLGVRWFVPGEFGEVVPQMDTIEVPEMQVTQQPDFPIRDFWYGAAPDLQQQIQEWKIHNKMNPGVGYWMGVPTDSSVRAYLPAKLFEEHPDWFAVGRGGSRNEGMPCMTNPEMIKHFVEWIKNDARAGKRVSVIGADDGLPRCFCEGCKAITSGFDGLAGNDRDPEEVASISQEWFHFINTILDEVNKEFPDYLIATNGYANRVVPPEMEGFNKSGNLVLMFADIAACTIHSYDDPHCWQIERQGQMLQRWCEICDKVWIYNYNRTMLVNKGTLTPIVHRLRRNTPLLAKWGLFGFFDEEDPNWALCGIPTWVIRTRLEWDAEADVDAELDDYFKNWFGPAAGPMRDYYDALEAAFERAPQHGHEDVFLPAIYTDRLIADLGGLMARAERLARSDTEKLHVRLERLMYDYQCAYMALEKAKQECRYDEAVAQCQRLSEIKDQMGQITPVMASRAGVYNIGWLKEQMEGLRAKTAGPEGDLVAVLPREARFRTDPFDDGIYQRWQEAGFDHSRWEKSSITTGWQDHGHQDGRGHPYKGLAWYRFGLDVPTNVAGKSVFLCVPQVVNEAWVWVNGRYVGRRPYMTTWGRPQMLDMDLGSAIVPGQENQITLRVFCNHDCYGASGIYERPFLYAKK